YMCYFFFSSRRLHTRCYRDWSSDVCSSDLYLGYAETAFFGGRSSAHIRKIAVPVVYTDFLSMYPTVNSLMDLWRFVTARKIKVEIGRASCRGREERWEGCDGYRGGIRKNK